MAGTIFDTQTAIEVSVTNAPNEVTTQVALEASVTNSFNIRATQAVLEVSATGTFGIRATQVAIEISVITCDSTSYVPPAPTGVITLTAVSAGANTQQINLSWTAEPGFTFTVGRSLVPGGPYAPIASGLAANSYHDTGLTYNVTYYYQVIGTDPCGNSTASNEASATPNCVVPAPPPTLTLTLLPCQQAVALAWPAVGGSTYDVLRGLSAGTLAVIASGLTSPSYLDSTVSQRQTYFYAVDAVNACGTSGTTLATIAVPVFPPIRVTRRCVRLTEPDIKSVEQIAAGALTIYVRMAYTILRAYQPIFPTGGPDKLVIAYADALGQVASLVVNCWLWMSDNGYVFLSSDCGSAQFLVASNNGAFFDANASAVNARNAAAGQQGLLPCSNADRYDWPVLTTNELLPNIFWRDGELIT
jgi:hypothetical protein